MAGTERPAASTETHLAAVRFATSNLERLVVHTVLRTPAESRKEVLVCLMRLYARWATEVDKCAPPPKEDDGGVQGPDCRDGWIPVGDDCIPPPGGGGPTGGG